jgi:LPS export ABC transporter protein LptC
MKKMSIQKYIGGLILAVAFFWGCEKIPKIDENFNREDVVVERFSEVDILYSDSGKVRVRVRGPVLLRQLGLSQSRQEFPSGIKVNFFDAFGNITSTLTGKYANRIEAEGITIVRDSVVWQNTEGKKLESTEITWNERTQKVYTNKFVVVNTLKDIIFAQGFTANQNFTDIRFKAIDGTMMVVEPIDESEPEY